MNLKDRYIRQTDIPQVGKDGQEKLSKARVLVIGAGGLGSPVLYYLTAAGIGTIGIADHDHVAVSNLNRQILHFEEDIEDSKAFSAVRKLKRLNSEVSFRIITEEISENNIDLLIDDYDVFVDCVDNLDTRFLVNRHVLRAGKMLVEAGVEGTHGFVMSVKPEEACFACAADIPSEEKKKPPTPVFGYTAGLAGSIQASECIKLILGRGEPLFSKVLLFNTDSNYFETVPIERNPACSCCSSLSDIF